jgi:hypothetical protein
MSYAKIRRGAQRRRDAVRNPRWGGFCLGALEALCVPAAFALLGLGWAEFVVRAPDAVGLYPSASVEPRAADDPSLWLVDGFNVVQRGLLGGREREAWWTAPRRAELLERAAAFENEDAEIWVVFDGPRVAEEIDGAGGPRQIFAPSADDWLLAKIRAAADPARVAVVTADRRLAARARRRGARVVPPGDFLRRCAG